MSDKMMENLGFPASWTDDQVRYANNAINQHDILTNRVKVLEEALSGLMAAIGGGNKLCGHDFTCICAEDAARKALEEMK